MSLHDKLLAQEEARFFVDTLLCKTKAEQITWTCENYYVWNHLAQTKPSHRYEIWNEIDFCTKFNAVTVRLEVFIQLFSVKPATATVEVLLHTYMGPQHAENRFILTNVTEAQLTLKTLLRQLFGQCALLCPCTATNVQYFAHDVQKLECISNSNAVLIQFALAVIQHKAWAAFYRVTL